MKNTITINDLHFFAYLWEFNNISKVEISKQLDVTYYYLLIKINHYKEMGLITTKKGGRMVVVSLTPKGKLVAEHSSKLLYAMYGNNYQFIKGPNE